MLGTQSEQLNRQGNEHFSRGHYTEAYVCYAQALECDRLSGDRRALLAPPGNLGNICAASGRPDQAQTPHPGGPPLQKNFGAEKGNRTTPAKLGKLPAGPAELGTRAAALS